MRKVPKVLQEDMLDCGPACLYAIFKYYHGKMPYAKIKKMVQLTGKGCDAYSLLQAGEKLGFMMEGKKGVITQIPSSSYPVIAHIKKENYYHFVVVMGIDTFQKAVFIMDPAKGYEKIPLSNWEEICTGNYLFFRVKRFLAREKSRSIWKEIFPKTYLKKSILLALFGNSILTLFELYTWLEVKLFFTYLWVQKDVYNLLQYFCFFLSFHLILEGGFYLLRWFFLKLQNTLLASYLQTWMKKLLYLPYYFYENYRVSALLERTQSFEEIYAFWFQLLETLFFSFPLFIIAAWFLSKKSFLFLIGVTPCCLTLLGSSCFFFRKFEKKVENYLQKRERKNELFLETFGKMDLLKGLHQEHFFFAKWRKISFQCQKATYQFQLFLRQKESIQKLERKVSKFLFLFLFLFASYRNEVVFSDFFVLEILFELLLENYTKILELFLLFPKIKVEASKLEPFLMTSFQEIFPKKSLLPYPHFTSLAIQNFTYQVQGNVKKSTFSMCVRPKQKVILHGPSGCGKSTLCKSILRYYPIAKGEIFLNQMDILYLNLEDLRSRICYLSQEEGLFSGTLLENITLGKKISPTHLQKVLEITHVAKLLKEKKIDLHFPISILNLSLSGGERKKILLARTLLLKRDIYLLDEVFESIEEEEACELIQNTLTYLKDKMVIVISHRKNIDFLFEKVSYFEETV